MSWSVGITRTPGSRVAKELRQQFKGTYDEPSREDTRSFERGIDAVEALIKAHDGAKKLWHVSLSGHGNQGDEDPALDALSLHIADTTDVPAEPPVAEG